MEKFHKLDDTPQKDLIIAKWIQKSNENQSPTDLKKEAEELLQVRRKLLKQNKGLDLVHYGDKSLFNSVCHQLQFITDTTISVEELASATREILKNTNTEVKITRVLYKGPLTVEEADEINKFNEDMADNGIFFSRNDDEILKVHVDSLTFYSTLIDVITRSGIMIWDDTIHSAILLALACTCQRKIVVYGAGEPKTIGFQPMESTPLTNFVLQSVNDTPIELCLLNSSRMYYSVVPVEPRPSRFGLKLEAIEMFEKQLPKQKDEIIIFLTSERCPSLLKTKGDSLIDQVQIIQAEDEFKIGLLGNTGTGKTVFINSVLKTPNLLYSPEYQVGAGTAAITEIVSDHNLDKEIYSLKIDYLDIEHIYSDIDHLKKSVILKENSKESYDWVQQDLLFDLQERVWSLFPKKLSPEEVYRTSIENLKSQIRDDIIQKINKKVEILDSLNFEELQNELNQYLPSSAQLSTHYNAIVKKVRITGNFPCLPTGVVLVDMPGLNDTNQFRVNATKNYLSKCSHVCIVVNIEDSKLHQEATIKLVKENLLGHPTNQISLIMTKMDQKTQNHNSRRNRQNQLPAAISTHLLEVTAYNAAREEGLQKIIHSIMKNDSECRSTLVRSLANAIRVFCTSSTECDKFEEEENLNNTIDYMDDNILQKSFIHKECTGIPAFRRFLAHANIIRDQAVKSKVQEIEQVLSLILWGQPLKINNNFLITISEEYNKAVANLIQTIENRKSIFCDYIDDFVGSLINTVVTGKSSMPLFSMISVTWWELLRNKMNAVEVIQRTLFLKYQKFFLNDFCADTSAELKMAIEFIMRIIKNPKLVDVFRYQILARVVSLVNSIKYRILEMQRELSIESMHNKLEKNRPNDSCKFLASNLSEVMVYHRQEVSNNFDDMLQWVNSAFNGDNSKTILTDNTPSQCKAAQEFVQMFCKTYGYNLKQIESHVDVLKSHESNLGIRKSDSNFRPHLGNMKLEESLSTFVGLDDVKDRLRKLAAKVDFEAAQKNKGIPVSGKRTYHMVFKGPPGTGKTTFAKIIAELLFCNQFLIRNVVAEASRSNLVAMYIGQTSHLTKKFIQEKASGGVLLVDEAYSYLSDQFGLEALNAICEEIEQHEKNNTPLVVIFAGYKDEMENLLKSNERIRGFVSEVFEFRSFTLEELAAVMLVNIQKVGLIPGEEFNDPMVMVDILQKATNEEQRKKQNASICRQVLKWATYKMNHRLLMDNKNDARELMTILPVDFRGITPDIISGRTQLPIEIEAPPEIQDILHSLVGNQAMKKYCMAMWSSYLVNTIRKQKDLSHVLIESTNNILITGGSGVGKSTAVEMLTKFFAKLGIIRESKPVVATRPYLVGQYVGETAINTRKMIDKAKHGVLYIDGIHNLTNQGQKDFGPEALVEIMEVMEDPKKDTMVIVSLPENQVKNFYNSNDGITRRIGMTFNMPYLSVDEIGEILKRLCYNAKDIIFDQEIDFSDVVKRCTTDDQRKEKGGRIAEELLNTARDNRIQRIQSPNESSKEQLMILYFSDFTVIPSKK